MTGEIPLDRIAIRTDIRPGDIGEIVRLHGTLYSQEYGYGTRFENYVAKGLVEFYESYDPKKCGAWICEHGGKIVGTIFLVDRGHSAQLRYFLVIPGYRGIGLGSKLMRLLVDFMNAAGQEKCFLWTTSELTAAASPYRRFGFVLAEEKDSVAFGKPVTEQKYVMDLGSVRR